MVDSSGEDTSKKRDNAQVHYDQEKPKKIQRNESKEGDKSKKADTSDSSDDDSNAAILPSPPKRRATERSNSTTSSTGSPGEKVNSASPRKQQKTEQKFAAAKRQAASASTNESDTNHTPKREIWDLESAMLYLVRLNKMPDACNEDTTLETAMKKAALSSTQAKPPPPASPQPRPEHREYLTPTKDSWITFGMAHSGDAATIANWYQATQQEEASKHQNEEEEKPEIATTANDVDQETDTTTSSPAIAQQQLPMLEHWLAEGLGDEVTCPSVYGLLAYVHHHTDSGGTGGKEKKVGTEDGDNEANKTEEKGGDKKPKAANAAGKEDNKVTSNEVTASVQQPRMAAVVLLTLAWTSNERHLRVEWMAIDTKHLATPIAQAVQQKLWLRISSLSVMTACPVIAVDEALLVKASGSDDKEVGEKDELLTKKKSIPPSAE